jgi:hypothetical protein
MHNYLNIVERFSSNMAITSYLCLIHSGDDKPYSSQQCRKSFSEAARLVQHSGIDRAVDKPLASQHCIKRFSIALLTADFTEWNSSRQEFAISIVYTLQKDVLNDYLSALSNVAF